VGDKIVRISSLTFPDKSKMSFDSIGLSSIRRTGVSLSEISCNKNYPDCYLFRIYQEKSRDLDGSEDLSNGACVVLSLRVPVNHRGFQNGYLAFYTGIGFTPAVSKPQKTIPLYLDFQRFVQEEETNQ
jgi:hypothetical protein